MAANPPRRHGQEPPWWLSWWRRLVRMVLGFARRHIFERGDVIDTGGEVLLKDIGLEHPDRYRYVPSGRSVIPRLLRRIGAGAEDVFIDVGSGKGRAVFQAARWPLKRVIGIELAEELNEVARYNVEHNRDRLKCKDVELITCDALEYVFPDDLTIAYFYHPFGGETFERVLRNLIASFDQNPRDLHLIYGYPLEVGAIERTGRFELVGKLRSLRLGIMEFHEFLIFRARPAQ
jgi:Histone methylation protein DOT1